MPVIYLLLALFSFNGFAQRIDPSLQSSRQSGETVQTNTVLLENLSKKIQTRCLNNSSSKDLVFNINGTQLNCDEMIALFDRLDNQVEAQVETLEDCEEDISEAARLANVAAAAAERSVACKPSGESPAQCMKGVMCSLFAASLPGASTIMSGIGGILKSAKAKECGQTGETCKANVLKGIFDSVFGSLKAIWGLAVGTVKASYYSAKSMLGFTVKAEDTLSGKMTALQRATNPFIKKLKADPVRTMKKLFTNLYESMEKAAFESYGCAQWSGKMYVSTCLKPMTKETWNCASCGLRSQVICGVLGVATGEIVTAFLTGGLVSAAKYPLKGAAVIAARVNPAKALNITNLIRSKIPKPSTVKAKAVNVRAAAGSGLTVSQNAAIKGFRRLRSSQSIKAVRAASNTLKPNTVAKVAKFTLRPIRAYIKVSDDASALGGKLVDGAAGAASRRITQGSRLARSGEAISDSVDGAATPRNSTNDDEADNLESISDSPEADVDLDPEPGDSSAGSIVADDMDVVPLTNSELDELIDPYVIPRNPANVSLGDRIPESKPGLIARSTPEPDAPNAGLVVNNNSSAPSVASSSRLDIDSPSKVSGRASVPAAARTSDNLPDPNPAPATGRTSTIQRNGSKISPDDVATLERLELDQLVQRQGKASGLDSDIENRMTLDDLADRYQQWDKIDPKIKKDVFDFLAKLSPEDRSRYFAILVNAPGGNPSKALARLKKLQDPKSGFGRKEYLDSLDDEIRELNAKMSSSPRDAAIIARERSALLLERTLIDLGDNIEIKGIFSANAHNKYYKDELGYEPHSLDSSFSVDFQPKKGKGIDICRGSFATTGTTSNLIGGFFTICKDRDYLDTQNFARNTAAPFDVTQEFNSQGYSRINSIRLEYPETISLGQNGPVTYKDGVQVGSGGVGGGIEFFTKRQGTKIDPNKLQGSVRPPICTRKPNSICDKIFGIQESARGRSLGSNSREVIDRQLKELDDVLKQLGPQAKRSIDDFDNLGLQSNIFELTRNNPELVSALNLKRELTLKRDLDFSQARTPLDADTLKFQGFAAQGRAFGKKLENDLDGLTGSDFERIKKILNDSLESERASPGIAGYIDGQRKLDLDIKRLGRDGSANPMDDLYDLNTRLSQQNDAFHAVRGVFMEAGSKVDNIPGLSVEQLRELRNLIRAKSPEKLDLGNASPKPLSTNGKSPMDDKRLTAERAGDAGRNMDGGLLMTRTGDVESSAVLVNRAIDKGQVTPDVALARIDARSAEVDDLIKTNGRQPNLLIEQQALKELRNGLAQRPAPVLPQGTGIPKKQRVLSDDELKVADGWSDPERLERARLVLGRNLSEAEIKAIKEAHDIGASRGFGKYEYTDIKAKSKRLAEAKITPVEIRALMEQGVAGGFARSLNPALDDVLGELGGSAARSAAQRAQELTKKLEALPNTPENMARRLSDESETITLRRQAGQGLANEAATSNNLFHISESWKNFAAAGDVESTTNMMRAGVARGLTPENITAGSAERISQLKAALVINPRNRLASGELSTLNDALKQINPSGRVPVARAADSSVPAGARAEVVAEARAEAKIEAGRSAADAENLSDRMDNLTESPSNFKIVDGLVAEYKTARNTAAEVYARDASVPGNLELSARSFAQAGNTKRAVEVMSLSIKKGIKPEDLMAANVKRMRELTDEINGFVSSGRSPAREIEVQTLREANEQLARNFSVSLPPAPMPSRWSLNQVTPVNAQRKAEVLREAGRHDEAALYFRRASTDQSLSDKNFRAAFSQSLRGSGILVRENFSNALSTGTTGSMNYVQSLYFSGAWRGLLPSQKTNLRSVLMEVQNNKEKYLPFTNSKHREWLDEMVKEMNGPGTMPIIPTPALRISIPQATLEHMKPHLGITADQRSYLEKAIKAHNEGKIKTPEDAAEWFNRPIVGDTVHPESHLRPFRSGKMTSHFPVGVSPDDVVRAFHQGKHKIVQGTDPQFNYHRVEHQGNTYELMVCKQKSCKVTNPDAVLGQNEVRNIYPHCGPDITALHALSRAKGALTKEGNISMDDFYLKVPCRD